MTWITLGLGSNINPVENLTTCLDMLLLQFHELSLSSVYESQAVGYDGPAYLNMAVGAETELKLSNLIEFLKEVERKHGRLPGAPSLAETSLDIDVLTFGNRQGEFNGVILPRPEILKNAHVLRPLSQVAGSRRHPETGDSYRKLWKDFDQANQVLDPISFNWHGRMVSRGKNYTEK